MTDDGQEEPREAEAELERLAREVVRHINMGPEEGRETLREIAVGIVRDEVYIVNTVPGAENASVGTFNFFGIGIPLFLVGSVFFFLFPPIGLVFFAAGGLTVVCGIAVAAFSRNRSTT
ncbi:MAG: hypothetical protein HYR72_24015 [Deltaproteobacteria bacterium]|nr:hypothetical protein [Deltaproteobacteria bacterium]MBI3389168.1 hypothetical protein [Deltaproteobacteria bacterium]